MPDRPATLRDVAAAARVHPATASRALNPETRILVSEDTARRVTDAAARLGYRPNPVARSLRTRRSHTVGVLIPDLNNPLFPPIVRGLEDKLAAAGYVALLGNSAADASRERTLFEQMRARHVDGFVLATATLHGQLLADAAAADVPVVLMNRLAPDYSFPSVSADNDMLAVGCYSALDERSLQCPEDISVIGFNDMPFIDRLRPPLTTVRFPHYQLGTEAAQLLLERIGGQSGPVRVLYLAPELVVRGSTAPYRRSE